MNCPTCGQRIPDPVAIQHITERELEILSAWWLLNTVRATARFFGISEQTVKNHLYNARLRNGVHTSIALAQIFMAQLASMEELVAQHNRREGQRERAA